MPFKKIEDYTHNFNKQCRDPSHNPPNMIVLSPGVHEYTCPSCGQVQYVVVKPNNCMSTKLHSSYHKVSFADNLKWM